MCYPVPQAPRQARNEPMPALRTLRLRRRPPQEEARQGQAQVACLRQPPQLVPAAGTSRRGGGVQQPRVGVGQEGRAGVGRDLRRCMLWRALADDRRVARGNLGGARIVRCYLRR